MIKIVRNVEKTKWSEFVFMHPKGNLFQTPLMYEIYQRTKNYKPIFIGAVDKEHNLIGVLLAVIQKEENILLGYFSSRSIIFGGPIVKGNNPEVANLLLKSYNKQINGKAIYTQFRNLFEQNKFKEVFEQNGFKYVPHLDILIDIDVSIEQLKKNIKREKRRNYTKSKNKGVEFKEIKELRGLKEGLKLIKHTYKRVKSPLPDSTLFISAFEELTDLGLIKLFGAYVEEKMIGIRIILIYKDLIYDWFCGSDFNNNNMYPNDYLIFNILLWGIEEKYTMFDFGGAGKPNIPYGVRDHKLKFGGELVEFGRFEKIHKKCIFKFAKVGLTLYKRMKLV